MPWLWLWLWLWRGAHRRCVPGIGRRASDSPIYRDPTPNNTTRIVLSTIIRSSIGDWFLM